MKGIQGHVIICKNHTSVSSGLQLFLVCLVQVSPFLLLAMTEDLGKKTADSKVMVLLFQLPGARAPRTHDHTHWGVHSILATSSFVSGQFCSETSLITIWWLVLIASGSCDEVRPFVWSDPTLKGRGQMTRSKWQPFGVKSKQWRGVDGVALESVFLESILKFNSVWGVCGVCVLGFYNSFFEFFFPAWNPSQLPMDLNHYSSFVAISPQSVSIGIGSWALG